MPYMRSRLAYQRKLKILRAKKIEVVRRRLRLASGVSPIGKRPTDVSGEPINSPSEIPSTVQSESRWGSVIHCRNCIVLRSAHETGIGLPLTTGVK